MIRALPRARAYIKSDSRLEEIVSERRLSKCSFIPKAKS